MPALIWFNHEQTGNGLNSDMIEYQSITFSWRFLNKNVWCITVVSDCLLRNLIKSNHYLGLCGDNMLLSEPYIICTYTYKSYDLGWLNSFAASWRGVIFIRHYNPGERRLSINIYVKKLQTCCYYDYKQMMTPITIIVWRTKINTVYGSNTIWSDRETISLYVHIRVDVKSQ